MFKQLLVPKTLTTDNLEDFVRQAIEDKKFGKADSGRLWEFEGPFGDFENVTELMKNANKARFAIGADGFVERVDFVIEPEGIERLDADAEDFGAVEFRFSFFGYDAEIPFRHPEPMSEVNDEGQVIITNLIVEELPLAKV
ncbi:MAG: hypothetical protein GKR98_13685 [Boseongicola sp.]|nr:MAG: hypothetical protein GKR98_13685 [Boseongicola sp.]